MKNFYKELKSHLKRGKLFCLSPLPFHQLAFAPFFFIFFPSNYNVETKHPVGDACSSLSHPHRRGRRSGGQALPEARALPASQHCPAVPHGLCSSRKPKPHALSRMRCVPAYLSLLLRKPALFFWFFSFFKLGNINVAFPSCVSASWSLAVLSHWNELFVSLLSLSHSEKTQHIKQGRIQWRGCVRQERFW